MNTRFKSRVRLCALALAGLAVVGASAPVFGAQDNRPVRALNGWSGKEGLGIGSSKTPFGIVEVGAPVSASSDTSQQDLYFHTSTQQPVRQYRVIHQGPGNWTVKSPHGDSYR